MNTQIKGLLDSEMGFYNIRTKEWHSCKRFNDSCHLKDSVNLIGLTWKEARRYGADMCGREKPDMSEVKDTTGKREKRKRVNITV